tara:strand:- start:88 stop:990 length:903 start_codon:yes stop_codon:yes gene_type:complete
MLYKHILSKSLSCNDSPNIIIYNSKNVDSFKILLDYLRDINSDGIREITDKISWESNSLYKIFDMKNINNKNIDIFFNIINELILAKNYFTSYKKIIILKNFNLIKLGIQSKLRVIIEKYHSTTRWILLTNKYNSIINPINSRCLLIRIPEQSKKDKRLICRENIKDISYDKRIKIYDKIYELDDINKILFYSEYNDGLINEYNSIHDNIYIKINNYKSVKDNIDDIRELSYNIIKYNINDIYCNLLKLYINDNKYFNTKKKKFIKIFSELENKYIKSFHDVIHIENLIINCIIINNNLS